MGAGTDCPAKPHAHSVFAVATVHVLADPVRRVALGGRLARHGDVTVLADPMTCDVVLAAGETIDDALRCLRLSRFAGSRRLVIVADTVAPAGVFRAVRAGAGSVLARADADADRLRVAVRAVAAGGAMSRETLDRLLDPPVGPTGAPEAGELTGREKDVLRLVADGFGNVDIARRLNVSPHTVKNVIHGLMGRLRLRNRTHAAAFAVRSGLV